MSDMILPRGVYPELPTPFEEDGAIDWFGYGRVLEKCAGRFCGGVLTGGRLSERATLGREELRGLVSDAALFCGKNRAAIFAVQVEKGPAALEEAAIAADAGARALLVEAGKSVSRQARFRFARALRKECGLPLILSPGGGERRLLPTDADFSVHAVCPSGADFSVHSALLSGADFPVHPASSTGADGFERVAAAAAEAGVPGLCDENAALLGKLLFSESAARAGVLLAGRGGEALFAQSILSYDLIFSALAVCFPQYASDLFAGKTNGKAAALRREMLAFSVLFGEEDAPAAVKWILSRQGICAPYVRLPLAMPERAKRMKLDALFERVG